MIAEFPIDSGSYSMPAHLDSNFNIRIGDILIDEYEHAFSFQDVLNTLLPTLLPGMFKN